MKQIQFKFISECTVNNLYFRQQSRFTGNGEQDNARLLLIIEDALLNSDHPVDMGHVQEIFRRADADHRGRFSGEQVCLIISK